MPFNIDPIRVPHLGQVTQVPAGLPGPARRCPPAHLRRRRRPGLRRDLRRRGRRAAARRRGRGGRAGGGGGDGGDCGGRLRGGGWCGGRACDDGAEAAGSCAGKRKCVAFVLILHPCAGGARFSFESSTDSNSVPIPLLLCIASFLSSSLSTPPSLVCPLLWVGPATPCGVSADSMCYSTFFLRIRVVILLAYLYRAVAGAAPHFSTKK